MAENFAFYSQTYDALPDARMRDLAEGAEFTPGQDEGGGRTFRYRWPDLDIVCHEMPARELPEHLRGFAGWVRHLYDGAPDERGKQLLDRIGHTRLSVGVVVEPQRDMDGRADRLLGAMANGLQALIFHGSAVFDTNAKLILAPDGSADPAADVLGPVAALIQDRVSVEVGEGEGREPTAAQRARYERAAAELTRRRVPRLDAPLYVDDDAAVELRTPEEAARRVLVLSAVTLRADGGAREDALALIERGGLWPAVSPEERDFLEAESFDPEGARKLLWRLEGLWVLAWVLGGLDALGWPAGFCDVPRLVGVIRKFEEDPDFVSRARLRDKAEILDALQLTVLVHWAVRDAWIHRRQVPEDLDWAGGAPLVETAGCPATGVVAERHHALNWLMKFGDADWDHVDTPT